MGETSASKARLWSKRIAALEGSGQSRQAWCTAQGLNVHTLDYWRYRLRDRASVSIQGMTRPPGSGAAPTKRPPTPTTTLVPVLVRNLSALPPSTATAAIELEWPNGLRLRTTLGANVLELSALVRALSPC